MKIPEIEDARVVMGAHAYATQDYPPPRWRDKHRTLIRVAYIQGGRDAMAALAAAVLAELDRYADAIPDEIDQDIRKAIASGGVGMTVGCGPRRDGIARRGAE